MLNIWYNGEEQIFYRKRSARGDRAINVIEFGGRNFLLLIVNRTQEEDKCYFCVHIEY